MRIFTILLFLLANITNAIGQYNRPYRIAYNSDTKSYLITNRGNGTITLLDSSYKTSTVVTGLKDPRDLAFGSFGGQSGLLVIDNNQLVVFETGAYQKVIAFNISPAGEIEDIEFDLANAGYFYLSDSKSGRILKGKVGPPPFYTPSYKVLASGLHRPKGLLYDSKGRLLVVTDTLNGQIIQIDTASGRQTVLMSTGIDSLNHLAEDAQGNYYLTNWDNSTLYRIDSKLQTGTKLVSYNNPAGMYINTKDDLLLVVCYLCDKLEFQRLHYFEPSNAVTGCSGDTMAAYLNPFASGIGTYASGNNFLIELSDSTGKFDKPVTIGSVKTLSQPDSIICVLPDIPYSARTRYRIRSTNPSITSSEKVLNGYTTPNVGELLLDTVSVCKGSTVILSTSDSLDFNYRWNTAQGLDDSTRLNARYTGIASGHYTLKLIVNNPGFECSDSGTLVVEVTPDIQIHNWVDSLEICEGDLAQLGVSGTTYQYEWSPGDGLSDSMIDRPTVAVNQSFKFYTRIKDTASGCSGFDSVYIDMKPLPVIELMETDFTVCSGDTIDVGANASTTNKVKIVPKAGLSSDTISNPRFTSLNPGKYSYVMRQTDEFQCSSDTQFTVLNRTLPSVLTFVGKQDDSTRYNFELDRRCDVRVYWNEGVDKQYVLLSEWNDVLSGDSAHPTSSQHEVMAYMEVTDSNGCTSISDTVGFITVSVPRIYESSVKIYPNPSGGQIKFDGIDVGSRMEVYDRTGKIILSENLVGRTVDLHELNAGVYVVVVYQKGASSAHRLILID